ncbi:hypothetical protein LFM09_32790 [Lentzea alba]|uniref:nSTAND1 domain-containing NTPase n=1 Tax=Lentzea alba TaxID=2714351 RepID=UPI0039BFC14F
MPRGERPLDDGDSPLLRFAKDLRRLRADAGTPTYRDLARQTHYSVTTLSEAAAGRKLPGLDVTMAYVRACGGDEAVWTQRWQEVAATWVQVKDRPCPYVGLSAFTREDADLFFGREKLTAALEHRLETQHFLAIFGASGEGKSSLLRAGVAAKFRNPVICTPGSNPDATIADALTKNPDLLIVDQFEELFTLCDDPVQRQAFLDTLLHAGCKTAIAVRSDFYPHCAQHPDLADALTDAQVLLGTMTPDELRRAITQPAVKAGCTVESDLLSTLVAQAAGRSGVLPLVSHALLETWQRKKGNVLTIGAYEAAGGIDGALAQSAETAYAQLDDDEQHLARQLLLRLAADGTKRPVPRSEVISEEALDVLANARLVTVGEDTVEVTHEALFRAWPRLTRWLDEDREGLRTHRRLTEAARLWEELERDSGALYRTARLAEATEWAGRTEPVLTKTEDAFLTASKSLSRRRTRRLRWAAAGLVTLVLAATGSAVNAYQQRNEVERLGRITQSQQLAALSSALLASNPTEAARKAVEAYRTYETPEARGQALSTAVSRQRDVDGIYAHTVTFGNGLIALTTDTGVKLLNATTLAHVADLPTEGEAFGVAVARDGRIAVSDRSGYTSVWADPHTRPSLYRDPYAKASAVAFSEDGRELVVGNRVWNLGTGTPYVDLPTEAPHGLDVRGDTLATYHHGTVSFWSIGTKQQIGGFTVDDRITDLKLVAGNQAVVGTLDGRVQLWSTTTGRKLGDLPGSKAPINLETNADGTLLASLGSGDAEIKLRNLVLGSSLPPLRSDRLKHDIAFTPDGRLALLTDNSLRISNRGSVPLTSAHAVKALSVDRDGTIHTFDEGGFVERRDAGLHSVGRVGTGATGRSAAQFSRDRTLLVTSGLHEPLAIRDATTGQVTHSLIQDDQAVPKTMAVGYNRLVAAGGGGSSLAWTVKPEPESTLLKSFWDNEPSAVAFGRSDNEIALGSEAGQVSVRAPGDFDTQALGDVHEGAVRVFAFSSDLKMFATGGDDGMITLWRTSGWRSTTWQKVGELRGHTGAVTALAFSPDSTRLVSGGNDRNVVVWNVESQTLWATLTGHLQGVTHVAWMPDGRAVVSAGEDALTVWPLDVEEALRKLS